MTRLKKLAITALVLCAAAAAFIASSGNSARPVPAPPVLWAVVNVDGTLARGSGAVSAAQLGADGTYEVIFDRDVTDCAYVGSGESDDALTIGVAPREGNPSGVYVIEYDTILARDSYSSGFHLMVAC